MDILRENCCAGKVVFVAGGSSGINLGIAERFAELGAKVGLISRTEDKVKAAAQGIVSRGGTAMGISADVRNFEAVDAAMAEVEKAYGAFDVVISGAAGNFIAPVVGLSANAFKTVIDIDLLGTFNVLRASFNHIKKPGASLISITAGQAERPLMFQAHAGAAKAGINNLTKTLAMEWGPAGIRVNAISPGPIAETEGMARLAASPAAEAAIKARIALRDYGTKRDIADMAVFISSDNAKYVTGAIIDVDGGSVVGDASGDALTPPKR